MNLWLARLAFFCVACAGDWEVVGSRILRDCRRGTQTPLEYRRGRTRVHRTVLGVKHRPKAGLVCSGQAHISLLCRSAYRYHVSHRCNPSTSLPLVSTARHRYYVDTSRRLALSTLLYGPVPGPYVPVFTVTDLCLQKLPECIERPVASPPLPRGRAVELRASNG